MRQHFTSKGILTFGKYRGRNYSEIAFKDPGWVRWCRENVDGFSASVEALSNPEPKPKRRTKQEAGEDAAFKKLDHNARLAMITERVRARDEMDLPPVHGFLDSFTAFDKHTAPY